jgi:chemotaxis protein methyltransferase CheR
MPASLNRKTDLEAGEFVFTQADYQIIAALVHKNTGIVLGPNKISMIYSRLSRRLRELKLTRFDDYCRLLQSPQGKGEFLNFLNAMTTNLTRFFREQHHFDHLAQTAFPEIAKAKDSHVRIWSAGCSSGEEPYSIAMTLFDQAQDLRRKDVKLLASDLDTNMLTKAANGLYSAENVADISHDMLGKYFTKLNKDHLIKEPVRQLIAFKPLNLLEAWPMKGLFDIIFCRNVMIYFDVPTKTQLVKRFAQHLKPGGWLYVGHSETLLDQQSLFRLNGRTIYRKVDG